MQYKVIRQFKIVMTQLSKRSLRERRAPKSFDSDNDEQDPWGYAKPSYSKEQRNPTQQLNSDAKLFIRFLASINKSCKEQEVENRKKEMESIKEPLPLRQRKPKIIQSESDLQKRQGDSSRDSKYDPSKKVKESYHFKPQMNNSDPQTCPKGQLFLNKCKAMNNESATKMLNIQSGLTKSKQPSAESSRFKLQKMQLISKQLEQANSFKKTAPSNIKADQKSGVSPAQSQSFFFASNKEKQDKASGIAASLNLPKPTLSENKIFKRSAYHVAIAYHIYLNKLREKGIMGNQIDPTYFARRLKEGMK